MPARVAAGRPALRDHRALLAVLGGAALLRLAVLITYPGGLFWGDSWEYVNNAWSQFPMAVAPDRPAGYSLFVRLVSPGHWLTGALVLQQLMGLAVAALAYVVLVRLRVRRSWAVVAAALIAFDGYAIALDQHLMPEALFTLLVVAALALPALTSQPRYLVLSALLLAGAILVRTVAVFAVPAWGGYLLLRHRDLRILAIAAATLAVPLLAYSTGIHKKYGTFNITASEGWFLYGRVGPIATCHGVSVPASQRFLCTDAVQGPNRWANFYIFDPLSPINRPYRSHGPYLAKDRLQRLNSLASSFARRMIREHPGDYARIAGEDFLRNFAPGASSQTASSDDVERLPPRPEPLDPYYVPAQRRVLPDYKPRAGPLAAALSRYDKIFHTPRWLMAIAALVSLAALVVARGPGRRRLLGEAWLFTGAGLAMLLGAAVGAEFVLRYVVPVFPLLVIGGALSLAAMLAPRPAPDVSAGRRSRGGERGAASKSDRRGRQARIRRRAEPPLT